MRIRRVFMIGTLIAARAAAAAAGEARITGSLAEALPPPGRPALLVFFSPACPACFEELFACRRRIEEGGLPVALVGVAAGTREELREFCATWRFDGPVVHDPRRRAHRAFGVSVLPCRVVLLDGRVMYQDDPRAEARARDEEVVRCLERFRSGSRPG